MRKRIPHFRFVYASADWAVLVPMRAIALTRRALRKLRALRRAYRGETAPDVFHRLAPQT